MELVFLLQRTMWPEGLRLMQDNDPKHKSDHTTQWCDDNDITRWETPPSSADLNPIELIWACMKHFLRTVWKPTTGQLLIEGILHYWEYVLDVELIRRCINRLHKVMRKVIDVNGHATGM